jgi:hypothetical protein
MFGQDRDKIELKLREQAERMRAELPKGETPEVGKFYAVSEDLYSGQGGYTHCFWEVLEIMGPKVFVAAHSQDFAGSREFLTDVDRRYWYPAPNAKALLKHKQTTSNE